VTILRDIARAKINLTLEVRGRRSDSYHELESLVAFAELGDSVELACRDELALTIDGPFAKGLSSAGNLVIDAANAAKRPGLKLGHFRLTKNLPVAAGLGGGSADAAAALRLLARANRDALSPEALGALAAGLGSDVTICLNSRPALMYGRGEKVVELSGFPSCGVLLANPGVELATAKAYAALEAPPLGAVPNEALPVPPEFAERFESLIDYARTRGNHLEAPALRLAPVVGEVLAALADLPAARLVRLSGSGATCFALFQSAVEAERAAILLSARRPAWWIAASTLG
jgi:4-diphosphocytidyl-2-C-methyl-D-erythritol kinase